jgi:histidinol dehydrogenase
VKTPTVIEWSTATQERRSKVISRNGTLQKLSGTAELTQSIRAVLEDVQERGDAALFDALEQFDRVTATEVRVGKEEFREAEASISPELSDAIDLAIARIRAFSAEIVERSTWHTVTPQGTTLGEIARPIESVGLFVPSGKGSFPSVLIQTGVPAVTANVTDIQVVVPPMPGSGGKVDPATLVVASRLGIRDVYRLNGPSGIGALAFGTESVRQVRKIVGPGSVPVTVAQQLVQSAGVSVVGGLGPTDSLIVADETADVRLLAADIVNEAEHGPDSSAVLVSTNRDLLYAAVNEIEAQVAALPEPRQTYARTSVWSNGGLILAESWEQAMDIANDYASEHIQFATADPRKLLEKLKFAGTALLGQWSTFACSNFVIGTPATLPTTGFAKQTSGVTAHTYLNQISVAEVDETEFWTLAGAVRAFSRHEGFPAHEASVLVREQSRQTRGRSDHAFPTAPQGG